MFTHQELMMVIVGYGMVGFFLACLIAGALSLFKVVKLDDDVRKYLFGTLLVSFGGVVIAYFQNIVKSPTEIKQEINSTIQENATRNAREILEKSKDKKLVYIQIANKTQMKQASNLQDDLIKSGFAAPGIETVFDRAPNDLQVRYRPKDDVDAKKVSEIVSASFGQTPKLSQLGSDSKNTGPIEVWFPR